MAQQLEKHRPKQSYSFPAFVSVLNRSKTRFNSLMKLILYHCQILNSDWSKCKSQVYMNYVTFVRAFVITAYTGTWIADSLELCIWQESGYTYYDMGFTISLFHLFI